MKRFRLLIQNLSFIAIKPIFRISNRTVRKILEKGAMEKADAAGLIPTMRSIFIIMMRNGGFPYMATISCLKC